MVIKSSDVNTSSHSSNLDKPLVILIHGLHQHAWIMRPLAKRLKQRGFRTYEHDYYSLIDSIDKHSRRLHIWLKKHHEPSTSINLVGHSLGGLVIRDFIWRYPQWNIGRCVTLGTPHVGSISAEYAKRLISPMIGKAYDKSLDGKAAPLREGICLGVIAGNSPYGLGQFVLNYHKHKAKLSKSQRDHDGAVYVFETKLPNATDHLILPVSHTGMLINQKVAEQTAYFLNKGVFKR